ncbi:threonine synthase [Nonomuraea gerenzanensis]|uniref:Threonine synthase n=1 Tax=Nonomuraea gerenzanensis TaxID=93944 RepID=A0A1M4ECF9_9ACTN|nr:threonine synthase [Nonomuraea gerenzanensis]UBU08277.1 threonine synthase [Nonomuraea gerenzanensis]SBO96605.1 Threonine synthase [Nonomuraea gerenzanensis]
MTTWHGLIDSSYRRWLPVTSSTPSVSLNEGNTPLLHSHHLSELTGCEVWLKVEGANPTGSFKDRGMTVAISRAAEAGAEAVICASTGNTSASAAAYAARAGLTAAVLVPRSGVALGKLSQAVRYGAEIVEIDGTFDDCLRVARELAAHHPIALVNSVGNELRLAGQRTVAYEIVDALGDAPDVHCLPVGNGGNITATWGGYRNYRKAGLSSRLPRLWGFQAAGAAPFVRGEPVAEPRTAATAINIGHPATWDAALAARDESGGLIAAVTDEQIFAAYRLVARRDGVFAEPASAAGVAGLLDLHARGGLEPGLRIVITLSGNGLKDLDASPRDGYTATETSAATVDVARALRLAA